MNVYRILRVKDGNRVCRFREFLSSWWVQARLKAVLAPVELTDGTGVATRAVEDPDGLWSINPFIPHMPGNSASAIEEFVRDHPTGNLAIILRPCELRTWVELQKRNRLLHLVHSSDVGVDRRVVTIGVDCQGTYRSAEFTRCTQRYGMDSKIFGKMNNPSSEDPIQSQLRLACRLCDWPAPYGADITIGSIGVVREGYLLVIAHDEDMDARLSLQESTEAMATELVIMRREEALTAILEDHGREWAYQKAESLQQFGGFGRFLADITRCTLCADCLDACPLYHGELSGMLGVWGDRQPKRPIFSELVEVSRWLASCSGCGMCEEACICGVSLAPLILTLSHLIREEIHYKAGDPKQNLPWSSTGV